MTTSRMPEIISHPLERGALYNNQPSLEASPPSITIVNDTAVQLGERCVELDERERMVFNVLTAVRHTPLAPREMMGNSHSPGVSRHQVSAALSLTLKRLRGILLLNGESIIQQEGKARNSRHMIDDKLLILDARSNSSVNPPTHLGPRTVGTAKFDKSIFLNTKKPKTTPKLPPGPTSSEDEDKWDFKTDEAALRQDQKLQAQEYRQYLLAKLDALKNIGLPDKVVTALVWKLTDWDFKVVKFGTKEYRQLIRSNISETGQTELEKLNSRRVSVFPRKNMVNIFIKDSVSGADLLSILEVDEKLQSSESKRAA